MFAKSWKIWSNDDSSFSQLTDHCQFGFGPHRSVTFLKGKTDRFRRGKELFARRKHNNLLVYTHPYSMQCLLLLFKVWTWHVKIPISARDQEERKFESAGAGTKEKPLNCSAVSLDHLLLKSSKDGILTVGKGWVWLTSLYQLVLTGYF